MYFLFLLTDFFSFDIKSYVEMQTSNYKAI